MATPQKSNSSGAKRKKWYPQADAEARRLGNAEVDWNLGGGEAQEEETRPRTRGQQCRRGVAPVIPRPRELFGEDLMDSLSHQHDGGASSAASSLTGSTSSKKSKRKYWKPPATRVIIEVKPVSEFLSKYLQTACPICGSELRISFPTLCVASSCRLTCVNQVGCTFADLIKPARSNIPLLQDDGSENVKRNTDAALNVLYVLTFIASGDGGAELVEFVCYARFLH